MRQARKEGGMCSWGQGATSRDSARRDLDQFGTIRPMGLNIFRFESIRTSFETIVPSLGAECAQHKWLPIKIFKDLFLQGGISFNV